MARAHADLRPEDITAVVDTREQLPLQDLDLRTVTGTLATGDYSIVGLEHVVCVERKSLADLVMCVGRERDRFERCVQRMRGYEVAALVVEAPWAAIEQQQYRAQVAPEAVIGSLYSWMARGIVVVMAGDRSRAAKAVSRLLFAAARERWRQLQALQNGLRIAPTGKGVAS
jgi:DNA excision repair protein ERCC-4